MNNHRYDTDYQPGEYRLIDAAFAALNLCKVYDKESDKEETQRVLAAAHSHMAALNRRKRISRERQLCNAIRNSEPRHFDAADFLPRPKAVLNLIGE